MILLSKNDVFDWSNTMLLAPLLLLRLAGTCLPLSGSRTELAVIVFSLLLHFSVSFITVHEMQPETP